MPCSLATIAFLHALVEEGHVLLSLLEEGAEDRFEQGLSEIRVVGKIRESDLGLDHPELGEVPAGVRVLGAKGRAEGVHLGEREAVGLDVELAGDGKEGLAAEEVLGKIHPAGSGARQVREVERGNAKQRARALGIGCGDDRRVDPDEPAFVEEAVGRLRERVAHARQGSDHVRARPQVRHFAQELERVRLGLDRVGVGIVDPADDVDRARLHFERLAFGGRWHDGAGRFDRAPGSEVQNLLFVVR